MGKGVEVRREKGGKEEWWEGGMVGRGGGMGEGPGRTREVMRKGKEGEEKGWTRFPKFVWLK